MCCWCIFFHFFRTLPSGVLFSSLAVLFFLIAASINPARETLGKDAPILTAHFSKAS